MAPYVELSVNNATGIGTEMRNEMVNEYVMKADRNVQKTVDNRWVDYTNWFCE